MELLVNDQYLTNIFGPDQIIGLLTNILEILVFTNNLTKNIGPKLEMTNIIGQIICKYQYFQNIGQKTNNLVWTKNIGQILVIDQ